MQRLLMTLVVAVAAVGSAARVHGEDVTAVVMGLKGIDAECGYVCKLDEELAQMSGQLHSANSSAADLAEWELKYNRVIDAA